jgi:hypothetical protein
VGTEQPGHLLARIALRSCVAVPTATSSATASASTSPTPTDSPGCAPLHFRPLPRTDLVGTLLGDAPRTAASEDACRWACCGASSSGCEGYAFAASELRWGSTASCFLYTGVTSTAPSSGYASGLRAGVAEQLLPSPAPPSASPVQTRLPAEGGGRPERGGSVTPSATPLPLELAAATTTPAPTSSYYCTPSLFRSLPRMDLVGELVGTALTPGVLALMPSLEACRQACCDAPACDGYSFAVSECASSLSGAASCFIYVNVTQLIPSSVVSSGIYESTL